MESRLHKKEQAFRFTFSASTKNKNRTFDQNLFECNSMSRLSVVIFLEEKQRAKARVQRNVKVSYCSTQLLFISSPHCNI